MSTTPPPVVVQKKKGMGCLGCGCLVFVLLIILLIALTVGSCYFVYSKAYGFTSATPADVQTFDAGDDVYHQATQKLTDFDKAIQTHQAASLHLNADELNTLIARDPDLAALHGHFFLSMADDRARAQVSLPTDSVPMGLFKGRYFNGDLTFGVGFEKSTHSLTVELKELVMGSYHAPENALETVSQELAPMLNQQLQKDRAAQDILNASSNISIQNGELVIDTE